MLGSTISEDLAALRMQLVAYRRTLSAQQLDEFDEMWGLDEQGNFLRGANSNVPSENDREFGDCGIEVGERARRATAGGRFQISWNSVAPAVKTRVDVSTLIRDQLTTVRATIKKEMDLIERKAASVVVVKKSDEETSKRLLHLFQKDLLPGLSGKILETKHRRDNIQREKYSYAVKSVCMLFLLALVATMLFYIYLFGMLQNPQRQLAWLRTFCIWLFIDVFIVGVLSVLITHFVIPMFIMKDVQKIKQRLVDTMQEFNKDIKCKTSFANKTTSRLDGDYSGDEEEAEEPMTFNSADHFFVSFRIAKRFPDLRTSQLILKFSSPLPTQSFTRNRDVTAQYKQGYSAAFKRGASQLFVFIVSTFIEIPQSVQDITIDLLTTGVTGYMSMLFIRLYEFSPILVVVPIAFLAILLHFYVKTSGNKLQALVHPITDKAAVSEENYANVVSGDHTNKFTAGGAVAARSALSGQAPNPTFKTRRQSVQMGRELIKQMKVQF